MDDPWDVKSVRYAGQYTSCMKLNGVPLLPPVLSKECRKEMQYYKLLAKEVEKRISILEPYITGSDGDSLQDGSDQRSIEASPANSPSCRSPQSDEQALDMITSSNQDQVNSSQLVVDFSLCINQTNVRSFKPMSNHSPCPPLDLPERDYNCFNKTKEILLDTETRKVEKMSDRVDISFRLNKEDLLSDSLSGCKDSDEPKSISSKNFTGSLNDIYTNSVKEQDSKLARQRSYTILNPSPQLLAHLEVQSLNTGVEVSNISMSESLSNISYGPNKKRRSWDLESAKVKWSSMALELKQKNINSKGSPKSQVNKNHVARSPTKKSTSPYRARSVAADRRSSSINKNVQKSEPIQYIRKPSPLRNISSSRTIVKEPVSAKKREYSPKSPKSPRSPKSPKSPKYQSTSDSEDPATRVRELYDKIQKQQLVQMANLVEKQKREQCMLQQVFEEQNSLLFKQLKTICPKSPIEAKEAWGEKQKEAERGPVSLSQLMNTKTPDAIMDSPGSTPPNNYSENCDTVSRKRNISGTTQKSKTPNGRPRPARSPPDGSRTRTHSPADRRSTSISRRLNYETSASSASERDREHEPMLTDRTNDTMADVNVTFPSDSETSRATDSTRSNNTKDISVVQATLSTDSAIRSMERTIQNSLNSCRRGRDKKLNSNPPTPEQRAAASVIVGHVRGYLVRRLFRTERVQTTVQTIKDALLCALQLHQDREGIRGADVDLHRRLIQQITAACYSLHDTFITSTSAERCAMIAADRERRRSLAARPPVKPTRITRDIMSQSHCGAFPSRPKRSTASSIMTQSSHESYNSERCPRARYMPSPRPRPWR